MRLDTERITHLIVYHSMEIEHYKSLDWIALVIRPFDRGKNYNFYLNFKPAKGEIKLYSGLGKIKLLISSSQMLNPLSRKQTFDSGYARLKSQ